MNPNILKRPVPWAIVALMLAVSCFAARAEEERFVGGLNDSGAAGRAAAPIAVRNDVAQAGDEIVTQRYFKIKKGAYPQFVQASRDGVWPYFEKLGARVIGMWKIIHPELGDSTAGEDEPGYDEVILMTRYASVEHWKATRETVKHAGNGPDWDKCLEALQLRRSLTQETWLRFLQGLKWENAPWFMPGLDETYERVEP